MTLLDALLVVRNCALRSHQMGTNQGVAARKVIDRKLQSLLRKQAWRNCASAVPIHMGDDTFQYPLPEPRNEIELHPAISVLVAPGVSDETIARLREVAQAASPHNTGELHQQTIPDGEPKSVSPFPVKPAP